MFQSIWSDIKFEYSKKGNYLFRIILINIAIFIVLSLSIVVAYFTKYPIDDWLQTNIFAMPTPWQVLIYKPWSFFLTFFSHYQFFHILFNMIGLYWFGKIVEDLIGPKKLLALYVLGGIASSLMVVLIFNTIPYFINTPSYLIGASGAVFAIAVGAAAIAPDYSLYLLLFGAVRIKYIVAVYIFLSILGTTSNAGGNIAHLGGALFGYVFISSLKSGTDLGRPIYWLLSLFDGKPRMKVTHRSKTTIKRNSDDLPNEEEVNRILDKINRSGYESLSKEEKQKLFKASQNQ
jgi:membrane associated rhomboid family serine protease